VRQVLFLYILIITSNAHSDVIAENQREISRSDFSRFDLDISYYEAEKAISFRFGVDQFRECEISHLELSSTNELGGVVMGMRLGKQGPWYMFQLSKEFLKGARVLLVCEQTIPNLLDTYAIRLAEFERLLNN